MAASDIVVQGAREHNLQSVDLVLPRNKLVCFTGVSGSGKSSLAFDTLYAEGQRRYVESLSTYARQFLGQMPKPDVDAISGLSPSISIAQKSAGRNPRSTVGTITEIYDYLRVLFARAGQGTCPYCGAKITSLSREAILAHILEMPSGSSFQVLAPLIRQQKGAYADLFTDLRKQGFARARVDGEVHRLDDDLQLDRQMRHDIEVVVDRLSIKSGLRARLSEAVELALKLGKGTMIVACEAEPKKAGKGGPKKKTSRRAASTDRVYSVDYSCAACGIGFEPPSPQLFSFNSPRGMCEECDGLGELYSFDPELLVPEASMSFKKGCIELVGPWKELGRWRRHLYQGVADTMERLLNIEPGTLLERPWSELTDDQKKIWFWGTGELHITYTWRGGKNPMKYGGIFDGIIPELISKYRNSKSKSKIAKLEQYMNTIECPDCEGERLNPQARAVHIASQGEQFADKPSLSLPEVCHLSIRDAAAFFDKLDLDSTGQIIAQDILREIRGRLGFLINVGLDYLALDRTAPTLSGGETQRIRLAGQIGCGLVGVLYILDEPSIGLHPRDNERLLASLCRLRDLGNTVLVVEHDEETMRAADHIVDFGPGPGVRGGEIVAQGTPHAIAREPRSVTGQFLAGKRKIAIPSLRRGQQKGDNGKAPQAAASTNHLRIIGARRNNLRNVDVAIPLGQFVCVTGVSGSGKSSLVNDILSEALRRDLNGGEGSPGEHDSIEGLKFLDKLIAIDQSPIGRTPRSNPGTYIKVFDEIRSLFSKMNDSKRRGYKPGRFSFNVKGGRCEACEGNGSTRLEMDFLADVWVTCPVCQGHRFNRETLGVRFKEKSISDVLEMDVQQALELFDNQPRIQAKLQTLHDVGLDYLKIGQPSPTLSGGEAQRIKLARELVKKSTGQTLYLLDEPTTGLHFADIDMLLTVLHGFVDAGNTVLVVEHNIDVIKTADWVIDLGPEGGESGGEIVVAGTPEEVAACKASHTGRALAEALEPKNRRRSSSTRNGSSTQKNGRVKQATHIEVRGARQHNLKNVDVKFRRDEMSVLCGPSGSGKSSLAMDTIYAEGQRRYVESLSSYARQFVAQMDKPALEHIEGLSPAIAIEQQNMGSTPRSTVGTLTEIYDYLRILMARVGTPHCPNCNCTVSTQTVDQIVDKVMAAKSGARLCLMAPMLVEVGQQYEALWDELRAEGYLRVRIDGTTHSLDAPPSIDRRRRHKVEVVVDRIVVKPASRSRIAESVENTLALGRGLLHVAHVRANRKEPQWQVDIHSQHLACGQCGRSFEPLSPHHFSFNSPIGWCYACEGLGVQLGANPAALLRDSKKTLAEGAIELWPNLKHAISKAMLDALSQGTDLPKDVPFDQLSARDRRILFHGTGDEWFQVKSTGRASKKTPPFRFQFKGLYPALEEAARQSVALRRKLDHMTDEVECAACGGSRLRDDAAAVRFKERTIDVWTQLSLAELAHLISRWKLTAREKKIAGELLHEIQSRLTFLVDVGLDYLTLGRGAATLSGGETQRIRLASQLGSGLTGVLYVLDEPTIGLHPRDNHRLLSALYKLRDLGNTLLVVEHDRDVIAGSDSLCDFGPGAGRLGGEIVAQGTPDQVAKRRKSLTGQYLSGKKAIPIPENRREVPCEEPPPASPNNNAPQSAIPQKNISLQILGARQNNLRNIDVHLPLQVMTAITGVSGSGKSSLIDGILYPSLAKTLHRASTVTGRHDAIHGIELVNKVIRVDQQALGNSPTSNPATYTGLFEHIRQLFSQLPAAKLRGYMPRRFSFNAQGGRCDECEGNGQLRVEMHFLPDVWVQCETCRGRRYNEETLEVQFQGKSISDVLDMTCGEALERFSSLPKIRRILQTLCDVGLDYLALGQPAPTLSGGEAQRVKLASELARPDTGRTLYLLDEPTTGLHFDDLAKLLKVMHRLVDLGNSVVVIEHNLDIIKNADWVIDLGPEAGSEGGQIVVAGTPEQVAEHARRYQAQGMKRNAKGNTKKKKDEPVATLLRSYTGEALLPVLEADPTLVLPRFDPTEQEKKRVGDLELRDVGSDIDMPWESDGRQWHTRDRVGRRGEPCRWDGRILEQVVDRIQEQGKFSETNWKARSVVEISAGKKTDGWFFHAITGEAWLVKMKFRVARGTFRREKLQERIPLPTLNEMDHVPLYSNDPRVRCKNLRGPWQEVQIHAHSFEEIDHPEFWKFLTEAVAGFDRYSQRVGKNPEDVMPWKVMGQKWHLSRKGFPLGQHSRWDVELLEELFELLREAAPSAQFLWNNQQIVHLCIPEQRDPWASVITKRAEDVELRLNGPAGQFTMGVVAPLGRMPQIEPRGKMARIRLRFRELDDFNRGELLRFLQKHLDKIRTVTVDA